MKHSPQKVPRTPPPAAQVGQYNRRQPPPVFVPPAPLLVPVCEERAELIVLFALCTWGSMLNLRRPGLSASLPFTVVLKLLVGFAAGLAHMHAVRYIHRDIKPENLLVHEVDGELIAKVGDLGLCVSMPEKREWVVKGGGCGTESYMAPEVVRNADAQLHPSSDVFSFGVTMFEVMCGVRYPKGLQVEADACNKADACSKKRAEWGGMLQKACLDTGDWGESFSKEMNVQPLWKLVLGCLHVSPSSRPSMADVGDQLSSLLEKFE